MTGRQYKLILAHLRAGHSINRDQCEVPKFGNCQRLPARIREMVKEGHEFARIWVVGRTGTKIMQYSLQKESQNGT